MSSRRLLFLGCLFACLGILSIPGNVSAGTRSYTSQADFSEAVRISGMTAVSDSLELSDVGAPASPAQDIRSVAVLLSSDATMDSDLEFLLEAYFGSFTFDGGVSDDAFSFSAITDISDLDGYDIVIIKSSSISEADSAPKVIVEQFADNGGSVVLDPLTYSRFRQSDTYVTDIEYALPVSGSYRDMEYDGTYFWTLEDAAVDKIIALNPEDGSTVAEYCAPDSVPRGIVIVSGTMYVSDSNTDKLYALDIASLTPYDAVCASPYSGTSYAFSTLSPASTSPWGLEYDGTFFYSIDSSSKRLYQFSLSGASLVQNDVWLPVTTPLAINLARGLAYDGTDLWLADAGSSQIYRISTSTGAQLGARDVYDGFGGADEDVTGITFKDGDLWMIDDEPGIKKLYDLDSYHRTVTDYFYANKANEYFRTPSTDGKGLAWDGSYFWITDDYTNSIYKLDVNGTIVSECLAPGSRPNGIAYQGGVLYVTDSNTDRVYLLDASTCATSSSFAAPGTLVQGVVHDGTDLWVADSQSDIVYRLNAVTGTVLGSFAAPGPTARGLAWDGTNIWSADETNGLYYALDTLSGSVLLTRTAMEFSAEGITFRDGQLWSVDDVSDAVYNVDSANLSTQQFSLPSGDSGGFVFDGTYIWVADRTDNMIHKLTVSGSLISSFASPAGSPQDLDWDGSYLRVTTDADDSIYTITTTGSVVSSFAAPGVDPRGIVTYGGLLYVTDSGENKIYRMNLTTGAVVDSFDLPGSAPGALAFDGTDIWLYDSDEKQFYRLGYFDDYDEDEGLVQESRSAAFSSVSGVDFIAGEMWASESYFDILFNMDVLSVEPKVLIQVSDPGTTPYRIGDTFYFASRDTSEGFYYQRRVVSVPETVSREVLATSNRTDSGAAVIRESRSNGGSIFVMDTGLVGRNYEISRQTVPADTLLLDGLGIHIHPNGYHENTRPTFTELTTDLDALITAYPALFTKTAIGTASDGETMYVYTTGTSGKPLISFLSGVHGNEEHAYVALVRFMESIAARYAADDTDIVDVFSNYEISFIPLANPYGIKNLVRYNQNGVDLNRNPDYQWASFVSSYKGSSAFSEPEAAAIRDYFLDYLGNIAFVNDSHSSMTIPPVFEWGYDIGVSEPSYISDVDVLLSSKAAFRWYEEKSGIGRWLDYDIRQAHSQRPFLTNWLSSLGIPASTTEVMGKKDIGTERMIHTSDWYYTHFESVLDAFRAKRGSAVYRIDTDSVDSVFSESVSSSATGPSGYSVSFRYGSSASLSSEPDSWSDESETPVPNRYLFVEVIASRLSSQESTPVIADFVINYADGVAPVISEVTPIMTPSSNTRPQYVFSSDEAGIIAYGGSCSGSTTAAVIGSNTIILEALADGLHDDCTLTVTDSSGNVSNILNITEFTINAAIGNDISDVTMDGKKLDTDNTNHAKSCSPRLKGNNTVIVNGKVILYRAREEGGKEKVHTVDVDGEGDWDTDMPTVDRLESYALRFVDSDGNESDISKTFEISCVTESDLEDNSKLPEKSSDFRLQNSSSDVGIPQEGVVKENSDGKQGTISRSENFFSTTNIVLGFKNAIVFMDHAFEAAADSVFVRYGVASPLVAYALFLVPHTSFVEVLFLMKAMLGFGALRVSGMKKGYGLVFDSKTGKPLSGTIITIADEHGRPLRIVSNSYGMYAALVPGGTYLVRAQKDGYEMVTDTDLAQPMHFSRRLYRGESLVFSRNDTINFDIAMRPAGVKIAPGFIARWYHGNERILEKIVKTLMVIGAICLLGILLSRFSIEYLLLALAYALLFFIQYVGVGKREWGTVAFGSSKKPVPFASVKLYSNQGDLEGRSVADEYGRYYMFAESGDHTLQVDGSDFDGKSLSKRTGVTMKENFGMIVKNVRL